MVEWKFGFKAIELEVSAACPRLEGARVGDGVGLHSLIQPTVTVLALNLALEVHGESDKVPNYLGGGFLLVERQLTNN